LAVFAVIFFLSIAIIDRKKLMNAASVDVGHD